MIEEGFAYSCSVRWRPYCSCRWGKTPETNFGSEGGRMDEGQSAESEAGASDRIQQHDAVHAPADPPDTEAPEPAAPAAPDVDVEVNTGDGATDDSQDDSTSGEES